MDILLILLLYEVIELTMLYVCHIEGWKNKLSDTLSRLNLKRFFELALKSVNQFLEKTSMDLWPLLKIWNAETIFHIN